MSFHRVLSLLSKEPSSTSGRHGHVPVEVGGVCRDQKLDRHGSEEGDEAKGKEEERACLQQPWTPRRKDNTFCPGALLSCLLFSYGTDNSNAINED